MCIKRYLEEPDFNTKAQLITALQEAGDRAQREQDYALRQQAYYQKQAEREAKKSSSLSYAGQWSQWVFQGVKSFFGSTHQQVAEKYAAVAEAWQSSVSSLSACIKSLELEKTSEKLR